MAKYKVSQREHWLMIICLQIVIVIAFIIYERKGLHPKIQELKRSVERNQKDVKIPRESIENPEQLKRDIQQLKKDLDAFEDGKKKWTEGLPENGGTYSRQSVKVALSNAAKRNRITIFKTIPYTLPDDYEGGPLTLKLNEKSTYDWELRQMIMESFFPNFRQFLEDIEDLSYQVIITDLNILALPNRGLGSRGRRIKVELIIAI